MVHLRVSILLAAVQLDYQQTGVCASGPLGTSPKSVAIQGFGLRGALQGPYTKQGIAPEERTKSRFVWGGAGRHANVGRKIPIGKVDMT